MIHKLLHIIVGALMLSLSVQVWGQSGGEIIKTDTSEYIVGEQFKNVIEATLSSYYEDYAASQQEIDSIMLSFGYDDEHIPEFSDSIYCERLSELNEMSPFHLDCNEDALKVVKFFAKHRRNFTSVVLGRSKLFFNMFEEKLAQYNLPLELKYLAVIESGLKPQAVSRAGATGLWQFMFRTGKAYGLNQNSYIDERKDPVLATDAACRYLAKLYSIYEDWNLVLAAYNAGPGNVNKAIRRSGGKTTYWEIRPFLPRETQGYVPNYIAMSYMLNYHKEHNIRARDAKYLDFEIDTICLRNGLHAEVIDSLLNWSVEDIRHLNPVYKTNYIPKTNPKQCINIPIALQNDWIAMEDSIYAMDSVIYKNIQKEKQEAEPEVVVHYVRNGQTLSSIARQYGTTVRNIMNWNNLRTTRINIGQRLSIYNNRPTVSNQTAKNTSKKDENRAEDTNSSSKKYTIQQGDNLWVIANSKGTSVDTLLRLNPGINYRDLKVGQVIRIQ